MPRLKVYDLATASWQYAGGVDPVALATDPAFTTRYPPKPSAGVVYGVNMYHAVAASTVAVTQAYQVAATVNLPSCPAGSLVDISGLIYMNQTATGTSGIFVVARLNGIAGTILTPTLVIHDVIDLNSWSLRALQWWSLPVGAGFTIDLCIAKSAAGGTASWQVTNTAIDVVLYRP